MKRFFLAALAIAAIASCAKNEVNEVTDNNQITFQTVVGPNTKALIDGTNYTDPSFGTFAYYNANTNTTPVETFPTNAELYIPESMVSYSDSESNWTTTTPYYWPKNGSLTFFSYSPYTIESKVECDKSNGITISEYDVASAQDVDVMVADVKTGQTENGSNGGYKGVPTIFRHKLSQIVDITFVTDKDYQKADGNSGAPFAAGDKQFFINYVKVNKLEQTGTYVSGNNVNETNLGTWTLPTTPAYDHNYDWFTEGSSCDTEFKFTTATSANTMSHILMIPQTYVDDVDPTKVSNVEIQYTIRTYTSASASSDDVVTANVSMYDIFKGTSNALAMNKKVTLNFTIGVNQIYWAPSVEVWGTATGAASIN